ncbi:MAG: ATP-binding protein [Pseudomonadota bacterium]
MLLLLSQLVLWAIIGAAESLSRPAILDAPDSVTLYLTRDWQRNGSEPPITVPLNRDPLYDYRDPGPDPAANRGLFTTGFNVDKPTGLAVYFSSAYGIGEVRLNDRLIKAQSPIDPAGSLSGFGPVAFVFPDEFVVAGQNKLEIRSTGRTYKALPLFSVGPASDILTAQRWGEVFALDLVIAATAMMIFVLLMCLLVDWPAVDRPRINALVMLLAAWSLRNLSILGAFDPLPLPLLRIATYTTNYLPMIALAAFAIRWCQYGERLLRYERATYAACIAVPIVIVVLNWRILPIAGGISLPWMLDNVLTIAATLFAIAVFTRHFASNRHGDSLETLLFVVAAMALLVDKLDNMFHLVVPFTDNLYLTFYAAPMFGLALALGMSASIAAQATRARLAEMSLNERLATKLAASETRIREHARQGALIEERRRIMQDMHDGLGAQLTALVAEVGNPDVPRSTLAADVSRSIDELRLMVDSLDTQGDSLSMALGSFRGRIEPALQAAGIELAWSVDDVGNDGMSAQDILEVFRILQTACANAIEHSGANRLEIRLRRTQGQRILEIIDNGRGMADDSDEHKGLGNMRRRAQRIGGALSIDSSPDGVTVRLNLPTGDAAEHTP